MRLLYLHDGNYDVVSIALKKGYEVVAFNIADFNYSWYPVNYFDILWVNLSYKITAFFNTEHILSLTSPVTILQNKSSFGSP